MRTCCRSPATWPAVSPKPQQPMRFWRCTRKASTRTSRQQWLWKRPTLRGEALMPRPSPTQDVRSPLPTGRNLLRDAVALQPVQLDRVAPQELVDLLIRKAGLLTDAAGGVLGVRKSRVGVRGIDLEADLVHARELEGGRPRLVVEDAGPDPARPGAPRRLL